MRRHLSLMFMMPSLAFFIVMHAFAQDVPPSSMEPLQIQMPGNLDASAGWQINEALFHKEDVGAPSVVEVLPIRFPRDICTVAICLPDEDFKRFRAKEPLILEMNGMSYRLNAQ